MRKRKARRQKPNVGGFLRAMRLMGGLTQVQLARRMRTRQSTISAQESLAQRGYLETVRRTAQACGLQLELVATKRRTSSRSRSQKTILQLA